MSEEKLSREDYIIQSKLLERDGWSKTVLQKLKLEPDLVKRNPMRRSQNMYLFRISKIEEIEKTPEFLELKDIVRKRKTAARKAVETKTKNVVNQVKNFPVHVERIENVVDEAIESYNDWNSWREDFEGFVSKKNSSKEFLDRITVNFIRHELTSYDDDLEKIRGKVGIRKAYGIEREKIFEEIAKVYPEFKEECNRQSCQTNLF